MFEKKGKSTAPTFVLRMEETSSQDAFEKVVYKVLNRRKPAWIAQDLKPNPPELSYESPFRSFKQHDTGLRISLRSWDHEVKSSVIYATRPSTKFQLPRSHQENLKMLIYA